VSAWGVNHPAACQQQQPCWFPFYCTTAGVAIVLRSRRGCIKQTTIAGCMHALPWVQQRTRGKVPGGVAAVCLCVYTCTTL
jgi:hypothetical protein